MARQLTYKQRRFIQEYLANGGNGTQAALVAYPGQDENSAKVTASQNLTKSNIRLEIESELKRYSVGPKQLAKVLHDALNAETEMIIGPGETRKNPDHNVRLKALREAATMLDAYPRQAASQHEHKHLHLQTNEPIEVMRFKVIHGRAPSDRELADLLGRPDVQSVDSSPDDQPIIDAETDDDP